MISYNLICFCFQFEVDGVDSFQNMLNSVDFYTKKALAKLHAAVDKTEYVAHDLIDYYRFT